MTVHVLLWSILSSGLEALSFGIKEGTDLDTCLAFPSWIGYLERISAKPNVPPGVAESSVTEFDGVHLDLPLDDLVKEVGEDKYGYFDRSYRDIPAPPWTRRQEAIFRERLVCRSTPPGRHVYRYQHRW